MIFFLYPLLVLLLSLLMPRARIIDDTHLPSVSMLVVVRNGASLIAAKLANAMSLDYPTEKFEVVVFSDGSTDNTVEIIERYCHNSPVKLLAAQEHAGKTAGILRAISSCTGDVVLFSDADALLSEDAVRRLASNFADPTVGGVCGQRVISKDEAELKEAQHRFIQFDSWIKRLESRIGSISSNDGKIYAIRRSLFQPIAEAVTDDLYACLIIVKQHYRFVFDPGALAFIKTPSRNRNHEVSRRRRIVCRGLRGIYLMRELLNPWRFGWYSVSLFCNKVLRRLLPVFLVLLLGSTVLLAATYPAARLMLIAEIAFLALALSYPLLKRTRMPTLPRFASIAFYFCIGNLGSLLGVFDFFSGRKITQWNPMKQDAP